MQRAFFLPEQGTVHHFGGTPGWHQQGNAALTHGMALLSHSCSFAWGRAPWLQGAGFSLCRQISPKRKEQGLLW